jgi:putative sigma-54 modulation protein
MTKPNPEVLIDISSRHDPLRDHMRDYATDKVQKLLRYHNGISRIQVILDEHRGQDEVEMIVHVDSGHTFVAKEQALTHRAAFDVLLEKMERQLKRDKERLKDHKIEGGKNKVFPTTPETGGEDSYDDIVRRDLG